MEESDEMFEAQENFNQSRRELDDEIVADRVEENLADEAVADAALADETLAEEALASTMLSDEARSEYHVQEGDQHGVKGDFIRALKEYKEAAQAMPQSSRHLLRVAEGYAANDQPYKAIEYYQRALSAHQDQSDNGDISEAHVGLGDLCCSFALSASAIRSYERAVRARPRKPYYRWRLAVALVAVGLYEQAAQQLQTAVELSPDDAFYRFQIADLHLLMHQEEKAVEEFEHAVRLAPRDEYYRLRLGAAFLRAGKPEKALPHFEQVLALDPDNNAYQVLLNYARAHHLPHSEIALEVETLELSDYDRDFVRRLQKFSRSTL